MKCCSIVIAINLLAVLIFCNGNQKNDFLVLKGRYLGQNPPGNLPKIFAPKISPNVEFLSDPNFTKDGKVFIFRGADSTGIGAFMIKQKNGLWSQPVKLQFSNEFKNGHFLLEPNEKRLYFSSNRPLDDSERAKNDWDIWYVNRTSTGWSFPQAIEFPINTDKHEIYSTLSKNGSIYFLRTTLNDWKSSDIYRSRLQDGKYQNAENLGQPINCESDDVDPYIAPDESYIIYCSHLPGGLGVNDIYISYQKADRSWTNPVSIGNEINSTYNEVCPWVTPDGKYFFFTSNRSGDYKTYWMKANFIENLTPENR